MIETSELTHDKLEETIKHVYKRKIPIFIWGATGVGKSMTTKRVAIEIANDLGKTIQTEATNNEKDFCFIDVRVSQLDPSDLRGLPTVREKETVWLPPNWLPRAGQGIIFFDELNLSPPSIQSSCYQIILDRRLGDYKLPDGYTVIAAGNRLEDRANVFEMSAPLCNRFTHATLKVPNKDEWTDWAIKNNIDNRIISFINFTPSYLFKFDGKYKDRAFPTPRSWSMCSALISGVNNVEDIKTYTTICVGEGTSTQLIAFMRLEEKIDIDDIMKNPKTCKLPEVPGDIDLLYCMTGSIATRYKDDKKLLKNVCVLSDRMSPEFGILLYRMTKAVDPDYFTNNVVKLKEFNNKYAKYLKE